MLVNTEDVFQAGYYAYAGYELQSCSTTAYSTTWRFSVPECDHAICQQEMRDSNQTILYTAFCNAFKAVQHAAKLSRQQMGHYSNYKAVRQNAIMPAQQGSQQLREQR